MATAMASKSHRGSNDPLPVFEDKALGESVQVCLQATFIESFIGRRPLKRARFSGIHPTASLENARLDLAKRIYAVLKLPFDPQYDAVVLSL